MTVSKRRVEPALTDLVRREGLREDRPQREDLQQQEQQAQGQKKVKGYITTLTSDKVGYWTLGCTGTGVWCRSERNCYFCFY